jgi:hypothetical protein
MHQVVHLPRAFAASHRVEGDRRRIAARLMFDDVGHPPRSAQMVELVDRRRPKRVAGAQQHRLTLLARK